MSRTTTAAAPWELLLAAILRRTPSLPNAACRGQSPRLFDADNPNEAEREQQRLMALDLCGRCPDREPCATWFLGLPKSQRPHGVVGGRVNQPTPKAVAS